MKHFVYVFNKTYTYAYKCIYMYIHISKKVMNLKEDRVVWECLR